MSRFSDRLKVFPLMSVRARFFATTLTLIIVVELISGLIFQSRLNAWLSNQHAEESERIAREIAQALSIEGVEVWRDAVARDRRWLSHLARSLDARISLLDAEGVVIYESPINSQASSRVSPLTSSNMHPSDRPAAQREEQASPALSDPSTRVSDQGPRLRLTLAEMREARERGLSLVRRRLDETRSAAHLSTVVPIYSEQREQMRSNDLRGYITLTMFTQHLNDQISYLNSALLSIFGLSLGFALLISGWAAQMLSQTLRRLIKLARELTHDADVYDDAHNYTHGYTYGQQLNVEGRDEYSRLAHSLTMLASQIESQMGHLAESRDRFEAVLDAMREAVIALDASRRISFANVSACRLLGWGYPPLGRALEECIQEDALTLFLRDGVAEDDPWVELELKDRRTVLARLTSQSIVGETVLVLSDITALRRLETVRRDFVANVSHELRTPTTVIQANAETLLDGAIHDAEVAEGFLKGIFRNAQRLARLVSDLLDLSRIESGTYHMRREPVEIREVLERVVDTLADRIIAKRIKIKLKLDDITPQPELYTDAGALEQIFTNLIENAIHYSDERAEVAVHVTPHHARSPHAQSPHNQTPQQAPSSSSEFKLLFEVIDDGPGIAEKYQARIFERFYRVDKGRSRQLGGTGLGLAIVKHLCGALGGELGLKSVEGEGCNFWFTLPLTEGEALPQRVEG